VPNAVGTFGNSGKNIIRESGMPRGSRRGEGVTKMAFVEVNGARFLYRFDGPEDAPVLMLCNSLGTDHTMWEPQVPALARKLRVCGTTAGHGGSAVTPPLHY
jgi:hypothetical protein